jgi:hypothetical protein
MVNVNKKRWTDPPFFMGKFTINMVIFHSYVKLPGSTNDERELSMAYHATYFE